MSRTLKDIYFHEFITLLTITCFKLQIMNKLVAMKLVLSRKELTKYVGA